MLKLQVDCMKTQGEIALQHRKIKTRKNQSKLNMFGLYDIIRSNVTCVQIGRVINLCAQNLKSEIIQILQSHSPRYGAVCAGNFVKILLKFKMTSTVHLHNFLWAQIFQSHSQ